MEAVEAGGTKRRHTEDPDDISSVEKLRECLLNTCVSKLTSASRPRRRRTLRHAVLVNNLMRSLERPASSDDKPQSPPRARITARRRSSNTATSSASCESTPSAPGEVSTSASATDEIPVSSSTPDKLSTSSEPSDIEKQQILTTSLSSFKHQQLPELLSSSWQPLLEPEMLASCDVNSDEVMSSPTATLSPLMPVDLTSALIASFDDSLLLSDLETPEVDAGCDGRSYDGDLNFFEPPAFPKTAVINISLDSSDASALLSVLGKRETHTVSSACKMFSSRLDARVPVQC